MKVEYLLWVGFKPVFRLVTMTKPDKRFNMLFCYILWYFILCLIPWTASLWVLTFSLVCVDISLLIFLTLKWSLVYNALISMQGHIWWCNRLVHCICVNPVHQKYYLFPQMWQVHSFSYMMYGLLYMDNKPEHNALYFFNLFENF